MDGAADADVGPAAKTAADRVVLGFVSSLQAFRRNPLIGGLIAVDPDALVPSTIGMAGEHSPPCASSSPASSAANETPATCPAT